MTQFEKYNQSFKVVKKKTKVLISLQFIYLF